MFQETLVSVSDRRNNTKVANFEKAKTKHLASLLKLANLSKGVGKSKKASSVKKSHWMRNDGGNLI